MPLTPKEKRNLKIGLPVGVVVWLAFLILMRPLVQTQNRASGSVSMTPLMLVIVFLLHFYFQHRDDAGFHQLLRRSIFWWAVFGSPFWMFLRASQEISWHATLTSRPLIEGLMVGATAIVLGWFLLRRAARRTRGREESEDSV